MPPLDPLATPFDNATLTKNHPLYIQCRMKTIKPIVHQSDERMLYLDAMLASVKFAMPTHIFAPNILIDAHALSSVEDGTKMYCGRILDEAVALANSRDITLENYSINEQFQAINSRLTAEGTLAIIIKQSPKSLQDMHVLIMGFGRTGSAVARLLDRLDTKVDIATNSSLRPAYAVARKVIALNTFDFADYDVVINTVPSSIVSDKELMSMRENCIYIDLASKPAINMDYARHLGINADIYPALPARYCPYSSALALYNVIMACENSR